MKKTWYQILFLILGLAICLLPLLGLAVTGPAPAAANEILAFPPEWKTSSGSLNLRYLSDACDYFRDHFSCRQELITLNAKLESGLLGDSASKKVVVGKDGWLFYAETTDDYQNTDPLSDRRIWAAAHTLSLIQEYARSKNAAFLFTVVPNKNTLYPQYMPDLYLRSEEPGNRERLFAALRKEGVSCLDLTDAFRAENRVLYHRLDSHWTNLGAALAHDRILAALGKQEDHFYDPARFRTERTHSGDLYTMLYPTGTEKDIQYLPDPPLRFQYAVPIRSPEDQRILTACDGKTGNLLMFRDSFGNSLHSFMAESYEKAWFSRAMPYPLTMLDASGADTLVIEIVERNIDWLSLRATILPAPVRELPLPEDQMAVSASLSCEQENALWKISGELMEGMDEDSPIYLLVDGTLYEASPVGEKEGSFTAYLPAQIEQVSILFRRNGKLVQSTAIACQSEGDLR